MREMKDKVRKKKVNWRNVMFGLHRPSLSEQYLKFVGEHPNMSKNRCAYYVLKANYSTTTLAAWRYEIRNNGADEYNILGEMKKLCEATYL